MPKHEKPFHLDLSFDEALRRFAQTDPQELDEPGKIKKVNREKRVSKPKARESAAKAPK
ncbi:MAG TPA: hypothetical protein VGG57_11135 [Stellaceae bacterium]|jgi:hypothetical protein